MIIFLILSLGGSKSLFVVTAEGRVFACGEGTNGRLGLSHSNNVSVPRQITALSQFVVKKVAVHSGGKLRRFGDFPLIHQISISMFFRETCHGIDSRWQSFLLGRR